MTFHVSDKIVEHSFEILKALDHARARAAYEASEKRLKVVLAREAHKSNAKTVSERENEALRSEAYAEALDQFEAVAEAYYTARDRREAAAAVIEAYRTQQSDLRAMGRVA